MKTIPSHGAHIPALGLGTWKMQGDTCTERVRDALELGYRHVDTAQMYENHAAVGAGLRDAGIARDEIFLTTKIWWENLSPEEVRENAERSLRELRTDYVDLLLVHWPNAEIPLEDTLGEMIALRDAGLVRHLGVSNFPPSWVESAADIAPIVCNQVEYHPFLSQQRLLETLRKRDLALVAYSPLAQGKVLESDVLREIADGHDATPAQVALAWLLAQEHVAAIPKASSREHLEDNLRALELQLTEEERTRLHGLAEREDERLVDPDFAPAWER